MSLLFFPERIVNIKPAAWRFFKDKYEPHAMRNIAWGLVELEF
jgi:hypothetical protein